MTQRTNPEPAVAFGTDGIRGIAGRWPCTPEVGVRVGRAAARLARSADGTRVLVGRDTRRSGEMLEAAVTAGITAAGADCLLAGVIPTSGVALGLAAGLADVGVVLTASHNPASDNGFKILGPGGTKLDDETTARVEGWLREPPDDSEHLGDVASAQQDAWGAWESAVTAAIGDTGALRGRRIAVDLANGALVPASEWLLQAVPAEWIVIGGGTGTINDGVGSEHLGALQQAVTVHGCAAGLAFDGDADRCRVVDERGEIVSGDAVAWLLARARQAKGLAVTVMSNGALERSLPGVRVVRTPVGDRHLREAMDAHGLDLGSEESGHVLFADFPAGDGLVTGLRTLTAALAARSVSAAFAGFAPLPRWLGKVRVGRRPPLHTVEPLEQARRAGEATLGSHGRVFLRYSGTEHVLRILVEGESEAKVTRVAEEIRRVATEVLA